MSALRRLGGGGGGVGFSPRSGRRRGALLCSGFAPWTALRALGFRGFWALGFGLVPRRGFAVCWLCSSDGAPRLGVWGLWGSVLWFSALWRVSWLVPLLGFGGGRWRCWWSGCRWSLVWVCVCVCGGGGGGGGWCGGGWGGGGVGGWGGVGGPAGGARGPASRCVVKGWRALPVPLSCRAGPSLFVVRPFSWSFPFGVGRRFAPFSLPCPFVPFVFSSGSGLVRLPGLPSFCSACVWSFFPCLPFSACFLSCPLVVRGLSALLVGVALCSVPVLACFVLLSGAAERLSLVARVPV